MKIKILSVKNFKSCPDGDYPLEQINFLTAKNGRGKTSLQMALRFLLNGSLPDDPIRDGEYFMCVSAVLDDGTGTMIGRELYLSDTYRIDGEDVTEKEFIRRAEALKKECDASGTKIMATPSSNQYFLTQDPGILWEFLLKGKVEGARIAGIKELEAATADGTVLYVRKSQPSRCLVNGKKVTGKAMDKFLADRMQCNTKALDITTSSDVMAAMDMPDLAKYLVSIIPVTMDFPKMAELAGLSEEEARIMEGFFPKAPAPITIDDVQKAYKALFNIRTGIKAQMKSWEQKAQFTGQLPLPDPDTVQKEYSSVTQAIGAAAELTRSWDVYRKRKAERERTCETYRAWVAEFNGMKDVHPSDPAVLDGLQQEEAAIRKNRDLYTANIANMQSSGVPLKKMLANLDTKVCPLCSTLVCSTDKTACRADLEANIAQIEKNIHDAEAESRKLDTLIDGNLKKQEQARKASEAWERKSALYGRIQKLKETIPEVPREPAQIPAVEGLEKKAARCQEHMRQISVFGECQKAQANYEEAEKQYELYCSMVKKTEPKKGIVTNTILEYLIAPFKAHINGFTKSIFTDMSISFGIGEKGLEVKCRPHGRDAYLPIRSLSDGERMLACFALMDMVSNIAGTRILVFDRIESLDADAAKALLAVITSDEVRSRYDHILLASTYHDDIVGLAECQNIKMIKF